MKKLLPWLPFIAALVIVGAAWGESHNAINSLDKRLLKAEQMQQAVNKLATGQAVIEERTLNIEKRVEETKRLIEAMRAELWRRQGDMQ